MNQNVPLSREQFYRIIEEHIGKNDADKGSFEGEAAYEPELDDLFFLYNTVRETAAVSILEFGSGWSTLALSLALNENRIQMQDQYRVRHPNPFRLMSVDASEQWMSRSISRIPMELRPMILSHISTPRLSERNGQIVTYYDSIPFFVPDIVYLDGPDPEQVVGEIGGFHLAELHGLPMTADLLRLEHHFWPGTLVIVDGRTANARMLESCLHRNWQSIHDPFGDRTVLRLNESAYGEVSEAHMMERLLSARSLRRKEGPVTQ